MLLVGRSKGRGCSKDLREAWPGRQSSPRRVVGSEHLDLGLDERQGPAEPLVDRRAVVVWSVCSEMLERGRGGVEPVGALRVELGDLALERGHEEHERPELVCERGAR